jgi:short-subunit dehydrogenase
MCERGGTICNVSMLLHRAPMPENAVYFATKSFVANFTLAVRHELAGSGVSLTLVCPGFTSTGAHADAGYDAGWVPDWMWSTPEAVASSALRDAAAGRAVSIADWKCATARVLVAAMPQPLVALAGRMSVSGHSRLHR